MGGLTYQLSGGIVCGGGERMDDNRAILDELEAAWRLYQNRGDEDKEIANVLCERVDSGHAFSFAVIYLAAKRKYQEGQP